MWYDLLYRADISQYRIYAPSRRGSELLVRHACVHAYMHVHVHARTCPALQHLVDAAVVRLVVRLAVALEPHLLVHDGVDGAYHLWSMQ